MYNGFNKVQENIAREETANITNFNFQFSNNFLNFLTPKNIFLTLQYSEDIVGIFLKQKFVERFSNILETLLRDYWFANKSTFFIIKSYTFDAKATFPSKTLKKIFTFKMLPKSFLDVLNIATLGGHTANIPGILRAGWVLF